MYNIGLETIYRKPIMPKNWSMEQYYDLANTLDGYFDAISNMFTIHASLKKYGKTPQLVDLVGASFEAAGITFSNEGIFEAIKDFFVWIKEKIVALWDWIKGFFVSSGASIKKQEEQIAEIADAATSANAMQYPVVLYVPPKQEIVAVVNAAQEVSTATDALILKTPNISTFSKEKFEDLVSIVKTNINNCKVVLEKLKQNDVTSKFSLAESVIIVREILIPGQKLMTEHISNGNKYLKILTDNINRLNKELDGKKGGELTKIQEQVQMLKNQYAFVNKMIQTSLSIRAKLEKYSNNIIKRDQEATEKANKKIVLNSTVM